jgi:hypothetical protein
MKQIIVLILLGFQVAVLGQELNQIQFIDYSSVIEDIRSTNSKGDLAIKWDYESLLLLDTANICEINNIRPDIVKDFRKNFSLPILDRFKKHQPTNSKNIKDYFVKKELLNMLLSVFDNGIDIKNKKMDNKVYIKDDLKAIYTIYGDSWSECYRISIKKEELLIELLYQIKE